MADIEACARGGHAFSAEEVAAIRRELLQWYDTHQRELPWRHSTVSRRRRMIYL